MKHTLNELIHCVIQLRLKRTKHEQANKTRIQNLWLVHRTRTKSHKCTETEFLCDSLRNTHTNSPSRSSPSNEFSTSLHKQKICIAPTNVCERTTHVQSDICIPFCSRPVKFHAYCLREHIQRSHRTILLTFVYVSCMGFCSAQLYGNVGSVFGRIKHMRFFFLFTHLNYRKLSIFEIQSIKFEFINRNEFILNEYAENLIIS